MAVVRLPFIGKPGPGSISEALSNGCPWLSMQCLDSAQERYNAVWFAKKTWEWSCKSQTSASAVAELLQPGELPRIRERAAGMRNRAVYEIPEIFEKILNNVLGSSRRESGSTSKFYFLGSRLLLCTLVQILG